MEINRDNNRTRVSAKSPILIARIKNLEVRALYDIGAEVNVISKDFIK